ncbi:MAG: hypothetical protein K2O61_02995 [Bacteroidaceae bacterium]|nr:hypothetical protein [Bacteroidaceae bacterium]
MMKKMTIWMWAWMLCLCVDAQAPNAGNRPPQRQFSPELYMKQLNEFVSRGASLTDTEQAKFLPMLAEMLGKQHELKKQQRELLMQSWKNKNMTETDYEKMVNKNIALDLESKKIEQTYYKKFHTVLSWKKVYAVRQSLQRFQMEALNHFLPGKNKPRQRRPMEQQ